MRLTERNEVERADSTDKMMHLKQRLVICNDEDTDGRGRVTMDSDEERVKKLRKLVNICQSYHKNKRVSFFYGPQCIYVAL